MSFAETISPLIGRFIIAWFFIHEAFERGGHWTATLDLMSLHNVPLPPLMLALALIVMMLGGILLALGYHTRHGAMLLFGFTLSVTVIMHGYWRIADPVEQAAQFQLFVRNLAVAGGLLLLVGLGPGPFAIDNVIEGADEDD